MEERLQKINTNKLIWQPDKNKMPILNEISLSLVEGSFYGIIGPNGAGKTSLAKTLLGFVDNSKGNVYLDEEEIHSYKRKEIAKKISFLPQTINGNVDFTVYEIVAMGREPYRKQLSPFNSEDLKAVEEAMKFTDCYKLKDMSITCLSGGERQRVAIARTIAQDTPWIILDEPVSSLDVAHQTRLMQMLEKLRTEKKKTIVAILHDINLAAAYCTHLVLMKDGKVYKSGKTEEMLNKENLTYLYDMEFDFFQVEENQLPYVLPKYI